MGARGAEEVRVRSRLEREESHRFYQAAGFSVEKTQRVFRRKLANEPRG